MLPREIYDRLFAHFGPQHWWPGDGPTEILVGTVLVQNTNWRNVEKAIENLREAGVLEIAKLYALEPEELAELIRPAGYYQVKTKRLRNLLRLIVDRYDGSLEALFANSPDTLREELLSVNGIGSETADCILLYAAGVPSFVADGYAQRVLARHGWMEYGADYYAIKDWFESRLEADPQVYNEYHALLVRLGKEHCKTKPQCIGCPLECLLPEGGPVAAEW
ncbi:MAG: endonuclease III domain-containing protein [Planctomycetia bacterium]|nr:endonuclease III domain-containing protein [Planctomycetia bacterium]